MSPLSDSDDDDDALDGLSGAFQVLEYTLPDRAELEIVTPMIEKELETMHKSEVQVSFSRPTYAADIHLFAGSLLFLAKR
jgi:hypothetical protein